MEAVIFIGLQGAGKSTFYKERFFDTHLRISLDLLKTRHRERRFLTTCVETGQRFVVDNTNPTKAERQVYIRAAKDAGFRVVGYYFQSRVEDCKRRNEQRPAERQVPLRGILAIRRGEVPWEEVEDWQKRLHHQFNAASEATNLPERPDYEQANALLIEACRLALSENLP